MQVATSIDIARPKEIVWQAITDIEHSAAMISSIISVDVLEQPADGFTGFKWTETRKMFGKEATETMWVTEAVDNQYYVTRAESHGAVYISRLSLTEADNKTTLTMSFSGEAQSLPAKFLSALMGFFIKGTMEKELQKDLADIKQHLEQP